MAQNVDFLYFCVAFHIFVAGNRRYLKFGMPVDHSKSMPRRQAVPEMGEVTSRDPL